MCLIIMNAQKDSFGPSEPKLGYIVMYGISSFLIVLDGVWGKSCGYCNEQVGVRATLLACITGIPESNLCWVIGQRD